MGGTVRAFLAVELAPPLHAGLVALKAELATHCSGVRWVRDEGLHATVKFLGATPEALLPAVQAAIADPVRRSPVLAAHVRGLGAFPSRRRPRVVWVGLECPGLAEVAVAIDAALEPLGFAREQRAFAAHVTLGRVTGGAGAPALAAALDTHDTIDLGRGPIAAVSAYRSDLRRGGALYTKLWTIPFGG